METLPRELYTWKEIPFLTQDQTTEFDYFIDYHALIKSIQESRTKVFALRGECQVYQYDNANAIIWMTDKQKTEDKFFLVTSNVSISSRLYYRNIFIFIIFISLNKITDYFIQRHQRGYSHPPTNYWSMGVLTFNQESSRYHIWTSCRRTLVVENAAA